MSSTAQTDPFPSCRIRVCHSVQHVRHHLQWLRSIPSQGVSQSSLGRSTRSSRRPATRSSLRPLPPNATHLPPPLAGASAIGSARRASGRNPLKSGSSASGARRPGQQLPTWVLLAHHLRHHRHHLHRPLLHRSHSHHSHRRRRHHPPHHRRHHRRRRRHHRHRTHPHHRRPRHGLRWPTRRLPWVVVCRVTARLTAPRGTSAHGHGRRHLHPLTTAELPHRVRMPNRGLPRCPRPHRLPLRASPLVREQDGRWAPRLICPLPHRPLLRATPLIRMLVER